MRVWGAYPKYSLLHTSSLESELMPLLLIVYLSHTFPQIIFFFCCILLKSVKTEQPVANANVLDQSQEATSIPEHAAILLSAYHYNSCLTIILAEKVDNDSNWKWHHCHGTERGKECILSLQRLKTLSHMLAPGLCSAALFTKLGVLAELKAMKSSLSLLIQCLPNSAVTCWVAVTFLEYQVTPSAFASAFWCTFPPTTSELYVVLSAAVYQAHTVLLCFLHGSVLELLSTQTAKQHYASVLLQILSHHKTPDPTLCSSKGSIRKGKHSTFTWERQK